MCYIIAPPISNQYRTVIAYNAVLVYIVIYTKMIPCLQCCTRLLAWLLFITSSRAIYVFAFMVVDYHSIKPGRR
jgi:hypothetical protein